MLGLYGPTGVYKTNFDGAIFWTQHSSGIGVIARDFSGLPMVVLSGKTSGVEVEEEIEARAALRAVIFAYETSIRRIVLEGDSKILFMSLLQEE